MKTENSSNVFLVSITHNSNSPKLKKRTEDRTSERRKKKKPRTEDRTSEKKKKKKKNRPNQ